MSALKDLIARAKAKAAEMQPVVAITPTVIADSIASIGASAIPNPNEHLGTDRYGNTISWNAEQWQFIQLALAGSSCILIGAAGTGKTTTVRGTVESLIQSKHIPTLRDKHKHLPVGTPGIVFVSYTRRAVMNLRKALPDDIKGNCITIHKLLEYAPVFYQIADPTTGEVKNTMRFEPSRNQLFPLDSAIRTVVFDESSMVAVSLFHQVWRALPEPSQVQFIFLGDIQQLPPIFGSAILGFKMLKLPVVELTQVYRQALESPIIRLAHRILSGVPIPETEFLDWKFQNQLTIHPWKKKISADNALLTLAAFFKKAWDTNAF
jgi:ATP-dependent exoDNAse (exonuclease V) alpha subunit